MPTDSLEGHARGLSKPPEGAIVGENVPRENDAENVYESRVTRISNWMEAYGGSYAHLTEREREAQARQLLAMIEERDMP